MRYQTKFIIFLLASFISCNPTPKNDPIGMIDPTGIWDVDGIIRLSEVVESIEYVSLEIRDECIVGDDLNSSAIVVGDRIYINGYKQPILVFDMDGKFLHQIGALGKGPGEYLTNTCAVDTINELVWILDNSQNRLLKFDYHGRVVDQYNMDDSDCRIVVMEDSRLAILNLPYRMKNSNDNQGPSVALYNTEGQKLQTINIYDSDEVGAGASASIMVYFSLVRGKLHFSEFPFRSIWTMNFDEKWTKSWEVVQDASVDKDNWDTNLMRDPHIASIRESSRFIFIGGVHNHVSHYMLFDKKTGQLKKNSCLAETTERGDLNGFLNDIDGGLPFWYSGYGGNDRSIDLFNSERFIDLVNNRITYYGCKQDTHLSDSLETFCNKLESEGNPVVMIVTFKGQNDS